MSSRFRTLVKVQKVGGDFVLVCVPAWNPYVSIRLDKSDIPSNIVLEAGTRLHAVVNFTAEKRIDLNFSNWEAE